MSGDGFGMIQHLFSSPDTLTFTIPELKEDLFVSKRPFHFLIDSLVYIPDQKAKRVIVFDESGSYIGHIGGEGEGPGEFLNVQHFVKNNNRLYVYDNFLMRISVYDDNLEYLKTIPINHRISDFIIIDNRIIAFSHYSPFIFSSFDMNGNVIHEFLKPNDEREAIFLARFQDGGLDFDIQHNLIYGIYPDQFKIFVLNKNLELQHILGSNDATRYRPSVPDFPRSLDPYKFEDQHIEYWESFHHIMNIYVDDNSGHIIIPYYKQLSQNEWNFYINVYQKDGGIVTEGVRIPGNTLIGTINGGAVYIAFDNETNENNTSILKYELNF